MGFTHVSVQIASLRRPDRRVRVRMMVDSGAMYSVVDGELLRKLGVRPTSTRTFVLADGTEISRASGAALFRFRRAENPTIVVFGEPGDTSLLGVVTLEEFGLMLDPLRQELRPMQLRL